MRVVADTHALLWFVHGSSLLSSTARSVLREAQETDGIVVSAALLVDLWYVTQTTGAFSAEDLDAVRNLVVDDTTAIDLVPIDLAVFDQWGRLDRAILADPWDRFIVATAIAGGAPLVSRDQAIARSGYLQTIW